MWADINGERKKVACGPCIRGHRSSKCDHRDRVLIEVRKPGRPLSSCPHPSGSCSCERVVINYTIPKTSECACPSDRAQPITAATGTSSRVQKTRTRKATNTFNPVSLEKAIKASQDTETDSSSLVTTTPTNPSFAPSDASNEASPPSSASSTPRILPSPSRKHSYASDIQLTDARPTSSRSQGVSSCCKPKAIQPQPEAVQQLRGGGSCCSGEQKEVSKPLPAPAKSCCSGGNGPSHSEAQNGENNFASFQQFHQQMPFQASPFSMNPNQNYMSNPAASQPDHMGAPLPFGFNTPIYNHMAAAMFQQSSMPMHQMQNGAGHDADHNCHCGDGCSCFGCAAHPHNATMTEYVRLMHQFMSSGGFGTVPPPTYDLPAYPHHPGFGAEVNQPMSFNVGSSNFTAFAPDQANFRPPMNPMMSVSNAAPHVPSVSSPWEQSSPATLVQPSLPNVTTQFANIRTGSVDPPTYPKIEPSAPSPRFIDSPSDGKDEETPTLSPSSFFWQEMELPGCSDATGTCQCGDGCECVGCLTHGGHNGIQLDFPTTTEPDGMANLISNDNSHRSFLGVNGSPEQAPS
ncbi:hypothetical protein BDV96DRAFT_12652 [Lophiotrema nucula]|uniref:Copper-fist domain-containing protein n=1 Tax=Lophiotrema nucula TaxID=690887 RepID=A0A6A5ZTH5_9PLEO|nr:hypothetical protein BDV96DRAFT_12652 [Lophiotrema nucula]